MQKIPGKNEELKMLIKKMSVECHIPQLYKKAPPQTIIDLPIVTTLQWLWSFIKGKLSSDLSAMQPDYKHQLLSHSQSQM